MATLREIKEELIQNRHSIEEGTFSIELLRDVTSVKLASLNNSQASMVTALEELPTKIAESLGGVATTSQSITSLVTSISDFIEQNRMNSLDEVERHREMMAALGNIGQGPRPPPRPNPSDDSSSSGGGLKGIFGSLLSSFGKATIAPISSLFSTLGSGILRLLAPLRFIARLVMRGGPIGIVLFTLYEVFKDIGDNPKFAQTLANISKTWNERILPAFQSIYQSIQGLISSDEVSGIVDFLGGWWDNIRLTLQSFFLDTLDVMTNAVAGIAESIDMMIQGDFIGGAGHLVRTLFDGIVDSVGIAVKTILGLVGFNPETVGPMVDTVTNSIKFVLDNFGLLVDILGAQFDYTFTWIENGFKKTVEKIKGFFATLGDKIYLMIAENLRFTFPTIELPLPDWAQVLGAPEKFTLMQGFEAGIDRQAIEDTRASISAREAQTAAAVTRLDTETADKLQELEALKNQLNANFVQQVVVQNQPPAPTGGGGSSSVITMPVEPFDRQDNRDRINRPF